MARGFRRMGAKLVPLTKSGVSIPAKSQSVGKRSSSSAKLSVDWPALGNPGAEIAVDLETQSVTGPDQARYSFEIYAFDKHRLMKGLDEISLTMEFAEEISEFVEVYKKRFHWAEHRA